MKVCILSATANEIIKTIDYYYACFKASFAVQKQSKLISDL